MDPQGDRANLGCDLWLWDGTLEYEGVLVKLADGGFTAYLREARRESARVPAGRRVATSFFDLQRQFVGRRFLAYRRSGGVDELEEAEVTSVQRSSAQEFDCFVSGRFHDLQERHREALKRLPLRDVGALVSEDPDPL